MVTSLRFPVRVFFVCFVFYTFLRVVTSLHIPMRGFSLHIPARGYFFTYSYAWLFFTHSCAWLLLYIFLCVAFLYMFLRMVTSLHIPMRGFSLHIPARGYFFTYSNVCFSSQIPVRVYLFTHDNTGVRKRWEGEVGRGVGVETEAKRVIRTLTSIRKAPHACCKM